MKRFIRWIFIKIVALVEMLIGLTTFVSIQLMPVFFQTSKPRSVYLFVYFTSVISFTIGAGLFLHNKWARKALVYFSGYIVLTKVLIFTGLLNFSGELITLMPSGQKELASFIYHLAVMIIFSIPGFKKEFS